MRDVVFERQGTPMYYDVNISLDYLRQDVGELEESEYQGFCVNRVVRAGDLGRLVHGPLELLKGKSCYSRVEVEFGAGEQAVYDQKKAAGSDLFVVKLSGAAGLDRLIKLQPDMITFDYRSQTLPLKAGQVRTAIKENIFFEIPLREGLCGGAEGVMWMRNVRRLLFITNGRNVVVSSGARCSMEVRRPRDIARMLEVFGLKRRRAEEVVGNAERLLRRCALKRYCHRGMIVHGGDEGALKRDFLLSVGRPGLE